MILYYLYNLFLQGFKIFSKSFIAGLYTLKILQHGQSAY